MLAGLSFDNDWSMEGSEYDFEAELIAAALCHRR